MPLVEKVKSAHFMLGGNPVADFERRMTGSLEGMRTTWREMAASIWAQSGKPVPKKVVKALVKKFDTAESRMRREWRAFSSTDASLPPFQGRVELSIPEQGFERATVQRLLLTHGRAKKIAPTPMAMFIEWEAANHGAKPPATPER
jgi:hypothetical protein